MPDKPDWRVVSCEQCHDGTFVVRTDPRSGRTEIRCRSNGHGLVELQRQPRENVGNRVPI